MAPEVGLARRVAQGMRLADAARECGIDEERAYQWRGAPGFRERVTQFRAEALDSAVGRLTEALPDAVDALTRLLKSDDQRIALRASQQVFRYWVAFGPAADVAPERAPKTKAVLREEAAPPVAASAAQGVEPVGERAGGDEPAGILELVQEFEAHLQTGDMVRADRAMARLMERIHVSSPEVQAAFEEVIAAAREQVLRAEGAAPIG